MTQMATNRIRNRRNTFNTIKYTNNETNSKSKAMTTRERLEA